jgi:two-component system, cell cycle sensor histidine kinase and response regulator CckA
MGESEREGNETILLVDDEEFIRTIAREILEMKGYKVVEATQGEEAVRIYRDRRDDIDLIILDMAMPVMGGRDAFMKLREHNPIAKVVLATGYSRDSDLADVMKLGINGFIEKPYRVEELASVIRRVLDEKTSAAMNKPGPKNEQ